MDIKREKQRGFIGYVEPAYHPAPFDTRVVAGELPQYEKVVYQVNERNVRNTFDKLRQSYELENLAASLTEPTVVTKSSRRRRWNQGPTETFDGSSVYQSSLMFPPIMIKSETDCNQYSGENQNQEFLEGLIAPPIIPVTRRHSHCEIDEIFNLSNDSSQAITRTRSDTFGKARSSMGSIIGDATTVRSSTNNVNSNEKSDSRSSQANLNRIRAFIEVN